MNPTVSVVIPTYRRPTLVLRSVESALAQTFADIEVIVVLAIADEATVAVLSKVADERLRVLPPIGRLNAADARNRGVEHARGQWIALLDDDDSWLADKLRRQLELAGSSRHALPIVSCGMFARDDTFDRPWPRRLPKVGEPVGDYMFCRTSLWGADGFVLPSTLLVPRQLLLDVPFRNLRPVEDLDWLLRAVQDKNVGVEFVKSRDGKHPELLVIWNIEAGRPHESSAHPWRNSLLWMRENRTLVSPEAYAGFMLTWVGRAAAQEGADMGAAWEIWREAARHGRPTALDLMIHVGHWAVPTSILSRISGWITGKPRADRSNPSPEI